MSFLGKTVRYMQMIFYSFKYSIHDSGNSRRTRNLPRNCPVSVSILYACLCEFITDILYVLF